MHNMATEFTIVRNTSSVCLCDLHTPLSTKARQLTIGGLNADVNGVPQVVSLHQM